MRKIIFISCVLVIFSFSGITKAWSIGFHGLYPFGGSVVNMPQGPIDGGAGDGGDGVPSYLEPLSIKTGIKLPKEPEEIDEAEIPTLEDFLAIDFDSPWLLEVVISEIKECCKEEEISLGDVLEVVMKFDSVLGEGIIKITSPEDAKDFAKSMVELTKQLAELEGESLFDDTAVNEKLESYVSALNAIDEANPKVKGTNILLGALDFLLEVDLEELENIKGEDGYELNVTDLVVELGKLVDSKKDWRRYKDVLVALNTALGNLQEQYESDEIVATIKDAEELASFTALIDRAAQYFPNYHRKGIVDWFGGVDYRYEKYWGKILSKCIEEAEGEELSFESIMESIPTPSEWLEFSETEEIEGQGEGTDPKPSPSYEDFIERLQDLIDKLQNPESEKTEIPPSVIRKILESLRELLDERGLEDLKDSPQRRLRRMDY